MKNQLSYLQSKKAIFLIASAALFLFFNSAFAQDKEIAVQPEHGYSGNPMVDFWLDHGYILSLLLLGGGVLMLLGTVVYKFFMGSAKEKYDYIDGPQKKLYLYAAYAVNTGFLFYLTSSVLSGRFNWTYFIFQNITVILFFGLLHFALRFTFVFYYPTLVEKSLKRLRYTPRKTSKGEVMELLSEEEEDDYLDEGMQAEEEALAVDYDVWLHRASGEVIIEKYDGYAHALKCPNCKYNTYKLVKEEMISKPTHRRSGKVYKYYGCTYCGHKGKRSHILHPTHQAKFHAHNPAHHAGTDEAQHEEK